MSNEYFTGGDTLVGFNKLVHDAMMRNELTNGKGAYEIKDAGGNSGYSYGPVQWDLSFGQKYYISQFENIIRNAVDFTGKQIFSYSEASTVIDLVRTHNNISIYTSKINQALSSDYGKSVIDQNYQNYLFEKISFIDSLINRINDASDRAFLRTDPARLFLFDYDNQYNLSLTGKLSQYLQGQIVSFDNGLSIQKQGIMDMGDLLRYYFNVQQFNNQPNDNVRRFSNLADILDFQPQTIEEAKGIIDVYQNRVAPRENSIKSVNMDLLKDALINPTATFIEQANSGFSTSYFNLHIDPDILSIETTTPIDTDNSVSEDNTTLLDGGGYRLGGIGNVNTLLGTYAWANNSLTDNYRPGDNQLSSENPTVTFSQMLDQAFSTEALTNAFNNYTMNLSQYEPTDPLVLDLNGDGVHLTDYLTAPVLFDVDHDGGTKEQTGWVSVDDGIVVRDINGNGKIDDISETLSEYYNGAVGSAGNAGSKPFNNGIAALKSLDTNNDNQFTSLDAAWNSVKIWQDLNHDGNTDLGELKTLNVLGITSISLLQTVQSGLVRDGNEVLASSNFVQNGVVKETLAANFIASPYGSTFTVKNTGTLTKTEGNVTSYRGGDAGESISVAILGVNNAMGGTGNDILIGDANNNWLSGNVGSDKLFAGAGDDVLLIDASDVQIDGGDGADLVQVVGNAGVSLNLAQSHIEAVQGGRGNDYFNGGGNTSVFMRGGDSGDMLLGGIANDAIHGENGNDLINGGAGNDVLRGGRGKDRISGGDDDDLIFSGQGDDKLSGDSGNDVLKGEQGDDVIDGADGVDIVEFLGSYADYRITQLGTGFYRVVDTRTGRDGADLLLNVEKLNFSDVSRVDIDPDTPIPVKDVLDRDASNVAFSRKTPQLISKSQLLANDIDRQGETLHIASVSDVQGGSATVTATGDVLFTAYPGYLGLMGFKYTIADSKNQSTYVIDSGTKQDTVMKASVVLKTAELPSDPLLLDQWYLSETSILPVWKNYTGKGVRIGQFEPAGKYALTRQILDPTHPDLRPNLDAAWLANITPGRKAGEGAAGAWSTHGTLVAGVMVGAKNGEGGVGVAYDAKIAGYWLANNLSDLSPMSMYLNYDVVNNSWGANKPFTIVFGQNIYAGDYVNAIHYGRSGLGTVMVYASGNDRLQGGNANADNFTNNRYGIEVGGIHAKTDLGLLQVEMAPFSSPGASLLVSAPASNVASSSRMLESDNGSTFGSDYAVTQGTSFATPIVSGTVALLLEANPGLGYRDVQEILALTAKVVTDVNTVWQDNHAVNWNGGAMHISHDYGFGEIDALAATRLAETWLSRQTWDNEMALEKSAVANLAIVDNASTRSTITMNPGVQIEHAEVELDFSHQRWGDLVITLIAPNGTESVLANRIGKAPNSGASDLGSNQSGQLKFNFMTTRDWGESSSGNWTLKVTDAATGNIGTLNSWTLRLYGKQEDPDNTYFYTDEYANFLGTERSTLSDVNRGCDSINATAVSGNTVVNLASGAAQLKGRGLSLLSPGNFENVLTGDGNDTVVGNAANNLLAAGRGFNVLTGNAGIDCFVVQCNPGGSDTITDFSINEGERIYLLDFNGKSFANLAISQSSTDSLVNLGDGQTLLLKNVSASNLTSNVFIFQSLFTPPANYVDSNASVPITTGTEASDNLLGSFSAETFLGKGGDDTLRGGAGDDVIDGGAGRDFLYGDDGNDLVYLDGDSAGISVSSAGVVFSSAMATGGLGADRFVVRQAGMEPQTNVVTDFDFNNPNEKIDLTRLGIYSYSELGLLQWTMNNTKMVSVGLMRTGENLVSLFGYTKEQIAPSMFIFSTPPGTTPAAPVANDPATSGVLRNGSNLTGNAGGNRLDGGIGAQIMEGRTGDDTYWVDDPGDVIVEQANGGYDAVQSSISYQLADNIEQLNLSGVNSINGTGNDRVNRIVGNAGNNLLDGQSGSDELLGGAGNDIYVVNVGTDRISENTNAGNDTVQSSVSWVLGRNLEKLVLTGIDDINGTGNALSNTLIGNAGNNLLDGAEASDILIGGLGDDSYVVDSSDVISEKTNEGDDTVYAMVDYTLSADVEKLILNGVANIGNGNAQDNVIEGNDNNNTLFGNDGNDSINGSAGSDTLYGGNGDDRLDGGALDSYAPGLSDVIYGENGDDTFLRRGFFGAGSYFGAAGEDCLDFSQSDAYTLGRRQSEQAGVIVSLSDNLASTYYLASTQFIWSDANGVISLNSIENIRGSEQSDYLMGDASTNLLEGGSGDDQLQGGAGADTLVGGLGNDLYAVDNADDTIIEIANAGIDKVMASISYTLPDNIEALTLLDNMGITAVGNGLDNILTGNTVSNFLNGDSGNDTLDGGALDAYSPGVTDTLNGEVGDDVLLSRGFFGAGIFNGGDGSDWLDFSQADSYTANRRLTESAGIKVDLSMGKAYSYYQKSTDFVWTDPNGLITIMGIENVRGSSSGDNLIGDDNNNILIGGNDSDWYFGGLGSDSYRLAEILPATDTIRINTGDSLISGQDLVSDFKLGAGNNPLSLGVDRLDLPTTQIAANSVKINGTDFGSVGSHSINNGLVSFGNAVGGTPLTITGSNILDAIRYLQTAIAGNNTVVFTADGSSYVFQDAGTNDVVLQLLGVTATGVNTDGVALGSVWIV